MDNRFLPNTCLFYLTKTMRKSIIALVFLFSFSALAQDSSFAYQGRILTDGLPLPDGEYQISVELFGGAETSEPLCGDRGVTALLRDGYFTHTIQDATCRVALLEHRGSLYVRVLARGGILGQRDVEVGRHSVSTGVYALHAVSGGGAVGDIVSSMLDPVQFQMIRGPGWVLADGSSYPQSRYAELSGEASVPDLRGVFLRGKQHERSDGRGNPEGDLPLGHWQRDEVISHTHNLDLRQVDGDSEERGPVVTETLRAEGDDAKLLTESVGGDETRPRNVTVNFYIRID